MSTRGQTPGPPGPSAVIPQKLLAEYVELAQLIRRCSELRARIISLLTAGVPVEFGPLTASIRRGERHPLTADEVKAVLGEDAFQNLMDEIPPVPFCHLIVGTRTTVWGAMSRECDPRS